MAADGSVLHTETLHIRFGQRPHDQPAAETLRDIVRRFRCTTLALGNGTACRETESFLSRLIGDGFFEPAAVQYTIVSESGASIYSCSAEARDEFPDADVNVISASSYRFRTISNPPHLSWIG